MYVFNSATFLSTVLRPEHIVNNIITDVVLLIVVVVVFVVIVVAVVADGPVVVALDGQGGVVILPHSSPRKNILLDKTHKKVCL